MKKGKVDLTLSHISASDAALSPSVPVNSIQEVIADLTLLATTISHDRDVHVYSKDVLLDAHVVGDGFIDSLKASEEAGIHQEGPVEADNHQEGHLDADRPLFVGKRKDVMLP